MSRLSIIMTIAVLLAYGVSARSQTDSADRASAAAERAKRQKEDGDRRLRAGDVPGAEAAYRKAAQLDPSAYDAYEALGNLLFSNNRYLEAVQAFQKAVQAEPRYVLGFYNIAHTYRKWGKYNEAINFYKKYLENKPDDPDAFFGLATAYEAVGQKQAALANYMVYVGKETRPSEQRYVIKAKDKVEELRKALGSSQPDRPTEAGAGISPSTATESSAAASSALSVPAPTPALIPKEQRESLSAQPEITLPPLRAAAASEHVATLLNQGDAAMNEQAYIKAMKAYYDAVKAEPKNPDALYRLGLAYQVNGNPKAAALRWRQALSVDPNYTAAAQGLAQVEGRPAPAPSPAPSHAPSSTPNAQPSPTPATISQTSPAKREDAQVASSPQPAPMPSTSSKQVRELINNGDAAFQNNNFYSAISNFLHAIKLDPNNEEALYKLGLSYAMSKNHQMAIFKWQQVLKLNPNNEMAKQNMAIAEQNLKGGDRPYQLRSNH
jgi:tetratricopeptide (TPR) repeat protein